MNEIKELLKTREKQLLNLKKEIEKSLKKAPKEHSTQLIKSQYIC